MNDYKNTKKETKITEILKKIGVYFGLSVWAIAVLFPFYWMVQNSFKSFAEYSSENVPKFFPSVLTFINYTEVFTAVPLAK